MLDVLFHYTDLNPFNYWPDEVAQVMPIYCGLPPKMMKYLLHHKAEWQIKLGSFHDFVIRMLIEGGAQMKVERQGLSILLTDYKRVNTELGREYAYIKAFLLHKLVESWITAEYKPDIFRVKNIVSKFGLVLKLTNDLGRYGTRGTILDTIILWNHSSKEAASACVRR